MKIGALRSSTKPLRCAYCHEVDRDPLDVCEGCGTRLHRACASDLAGCPTLGCTERRRSAPAHPPFAWHRASAGFLLILFAWADLARGSHASLDLRFTEAALLGLPGLWLLVSALAPAIRRSARRTST